MSRAAQLVVIDDQPVVHSGVRAWVADASNLHGDVHAYKSVPEFLRERQRASTATEVVIFDPQHGDYRPDYAAVEQLCKLQLRVVAYSRIAAPEVILSCLDAGAADYIVKTEAPQCLLDAIKAAQVGRKSRGPIAAAAVESAQQRGRPELTAQERRVLIEWLLTDNKESVSRKLHIASSTVRTHLQRIRRRYNEIDRSAPSKAALFARAIQDGLIGIYDV